ncbi:MAG: malonyl-CoA decarboxylase [Gammaproteobacteria bacterium]|nr:malonyl-CoA decarboxylase [Gammaproteobacteria bacterium]
MNAPSAPGLLDRTLANLRSGWRRISSSGHAGKIPRLRADLPDADREALKQQMRECLESKGGEVSARARAAALGHAYLDLNHQGKRRFLETLAYDFAVEPEALQDCANAVLKAGDLNAQLSAMSRLREVLTPPRVKLLTQFNALPEGVRFLVDLRADLLEHTGDNLIMQSLDADLKGLLASWFDIGFLDLKRITWKEPAALLEKLIAYEAVHEIRSWEDLKHRLNSDRRCYAYFHPRMPDEPLIFVQVALVSGMADDIQNLLDESRPAQDPETADAGIFYSISNTQKGLQGVSFGDFLIKRVVDHLSKDLTNLKTFATLSPVPGFRRFLDELITQADSKLLTKAETDKLNSIADTDKESCELKDILSRRDWHQNEELANILKGPLMRLGAQYLLEEKTNNRARDRVANFHLSNGARVERINWLADTSERGMLRSAGLMVNYRYKLSDIEKNHETYSASGEVVASSAVKSLLK